MRLERYLHLPVLEPGSGQREQQRRFLAGNADPDWAILVGELPEASTCPAHSHPETFLPVSLIELVQNSLRPSRFRSAVLLRQ